MKRNIFAIILFTFSLSSFAQQTTKRSEIYMHKSGEYVDAVRIYEGGKQVGTRIQLWAINQKDKKSNNFINISYLKPIEFYVFINELIDCFKYEKGTSIRVSGLIVKVDEDFRKDNLIVYSKKNSSDYHSFKLENLEKIRYNFEKWCDKNKVNYSEEEVDKKIEVDYDAIIKKYTIDSSGNAVIKPITPAEVNKKNKK